jgi:formamidopyrimidine-DNA glycosylase
VPELPELTVYLEALAVRALGRQLEGTRVASPFFVRTAEPPLAAAAGRTLVELRRVGKRLVLGLEGELFLAVHLMIAGRLRWRPRGAPFPGRVGLAAFDFATGTLLVTEASSKKRASLHLLEGREALAGLDPGGLEVLAASAEQVAGALRRENRTLKRALTDPRILAGIGNAFSDEILFAARLSPLRLTRSLSDEETARLHGAARQVLEGWTERLRAELGERFPDKVTAARAGMAVHGRFGQPCPECGAPVQRIRYAENECDYCARCQNQGRLLADRSLSRLLRRDWPRTLEELEERQARVSHWPAER